MTRILGIIFCLFVPFVIMGQQNCPVWIDGCHLDGVNTYIDVFSATADSYDDAMEQAIQRIADARSLATGQRTSIEKTNDGNIVILAKDELTLKCRIVDEYTEVQPNNKVKVSLLVQTARNPTFDYEPVAITNKYPFSARAFVPGFAQIHKGSMTKGVCFIAAEALAIGGAFVFEGLRSDYNSKINRTHNASEKKDYINKADNMTNLRNGFIIGAAAIYVWNIIDGAVAKGKTRVTLGDAEARLSPFATPESAGVMFAITF